MSILSFAEMKVHDFKGNLSVDIIFIFPGHKTANGRTLGFFPANHLEHFQLASGPNLLRVERNLSNPKASHFLSIQTIEWKLAGYDCWSGLGKAISML